MFLFRHVFVCIFHSVEHLDIADCCGNNIKSGIETSQQSWIYVLHKIPEVTLSGASENGALTILLASCGSYVILWKQKF